MTATAATTRPTTCGGLYVTLTGTEGADLTLASQGCKRLPRHTGEHRAFRTMREMHRAEAAANRPATASPKGKKRAKGRTATIAERRSMIALLRSEAGARPRGRVTPAQRRTMFTSLMAMVNGGNMPASDALGVAALF